MTPAISVTLPLATQTVINKRQKSEKTALRKPDVKKGNRPEDGEIILITL